MLTSKKPARRDGKASGPQNGDGRSGGSSTSTATKALITRNLRTAFDQVAGEPIPDRMLELLDQLSAKEEATKKEGQ
jgi:hypothetical protein